MFKTTLRLSAFLLIFAGAFYCGRTSKHCDCEANVAETLASHIQLAGLPSQPKAKRTIEFQLQKTSAIFDSSKGFLSSETNVAKKKTWNPDRLDLPYYLEWDEENQRFISEGKPLEYQQRQCRNFLVSDVNEFAFHWQKISSIDTAIAFE